VTIATVDATAYSGYENAIFAPGSRRVVVSYKRFLRDPDGTNGAVMPAHLVVAVSRDSGATWVTSVIDRRAGEVGDTQSCSVAIDGVPGVLYVAYLAQTGEGYDDMSLRIAKSTDGGTTWTTRRIATGGVGVFTAIDVVDDDTVLVSTSWEKWPASQLRLYSTTDGGDHWTRSIVDDFGWYTGVGSTTAGTTWLSYYHPGDTDLYTATRQSATGPWTRSLIDGASADGRFTGLAGSLALSRSGRLFLSFEDTDVTWVLTTSNGGATWARSRLGPGGWDTGIDLRRDSATGRLHVFVAFWHWRPNRPSQVMLSTSPDGGRTWALGQVLEKTNVDPYLDITAPTPDIRFVSYQTHNLVTDAIKLRVARVTG
jgi:hypothetical protein